MEKTYELNGQVIEVRYADQSLHITNNDALKAFLQPDLEERSRVLAEIVHNDFEKINGYALDFSIPSLTIEIIGHVYAGHVAEAIEKATSIRLLDQFMQKIIDRCAIIDAGQPGFDMDRRVWDMLAPFTHQIVQCLPGKSSLS